MDKAAREGNTLNISVTANTETEAREATIRISATDAGVTAVDVKITQSGISTGTEDNKKPLLQVSATELEFVDVDAAPQQVTVTAEGGVVWKANSEFNWILVEESGDILTISVLDNEDSLERVGYVSVYNDNDDVQVQPLTIGVTQIALNVEPSITIMNLPEGGNIIYRHYEDNTLSSNVESRHMQVFIEPKSASWTVEDVDIPSWLNITRSGSNGDYLAMIVDTNLLGPDVSEGSFTVKHSNPDVEPVKVTIHKKPVEYFNFESTLENDVDLTPTKTDVQITTYGNGYTQDYALIEMAFFTDNVKYDRGGYVRESDNMIYRYSGSGEIVLIEMYGENLITDLTPGTYTIDPNVEPGTTAKRDGRKDGVAAPGLPVRLGKRIDLRGCSYALIDNNIEEDKAFAVAKNGTITVDKNGDDYTISWNFGTDSGYSITGSYTGPLNINRKFLEFNFGMGGGEGGL